MPVELDGDGAADAGDDQMDADHDDADDDDMPHEEDDDKQKKLHAKEYEEMDDARDKLADFAKGESKKRKKSPEDGSKEHGTHGDYHQGWKYRNRNKGNYGNSHGHGWRGWRSLFLEGKGKGKKWSKPHWQWQEWKGAPAPSSHPGGEVHRRSYAPTRKVATTLPNGQGYIDANMQYDDVRCASRLVSVLIPQTQ